jgi:subtilisin family serine protease
MRRFLLLLLCSLAAIPGAVRAVAPVHAEDDTQYVLVQYAQSGVMAQTSRPPETLAEEGYRSIPVPAGMSTDAYIAQLEQQPDVPAAYPNVRVTAAATPNDPYYAQNQAPYLNLIRAPAAWDLVTGSKNPVVVAVLDSGLDIDHPEFAGRLWENPHDSTANGLDDDGNGCVDDHYGCRFVDLTSDNRDGCGYTSSTPSGNIRDDNGKPGSSSHSHGTLVGGIIGAAGNNGIGVTGVAWNVRLMTVKVLDCGPNGRLPTGSMSNVADGIRYAVRNGAQIISLSLASAPGDQKGDIQPLRDAIAEAQAKGVIIVTAAGNHTPGASQVGPGYPGAYSQFPNLITVGASDLQGQWATFSNYGPALDIAAPGVSIASTVRTDLGLGEPYGTSTEGGTSFSTPLVSGVLALMMSRNSSLSMSDYVSILKSTATPAVDAPHGQNWAGAGIVNAGRAVASIPLTITGAALNDFKDVPSGTAITAMVGNEDCGTTTTTIFGQQARFSLRVSADGEEAGCGAPGRQVQFILGGVTVDPPLPWPGVDESLALPNHDLSAVSPPPGPVVLETLNDGWSNVPVLEAGGSLPGALASLSAAWSAILRWDPSKPTLFGIGAYRIFAANTPDYATDLGRVDRYDAIWVYGPAATVATGNPNPPLGRQVVLRQGWNNIVWTGTNRAIADALAEVDGKYTEVAQYDNASQMWRIYAPGKPRYANDFGGLFKLQTYWVYMTEPGTITMN